MAIIANENMKRRLKHIGVDAFLAQRKGLLDLYDQAKSKIADDHVKMEHGILAESVFRNWLNSFLPKRFAAAKGYIITHNLNYDGPLEEWDILIYDALEAPVLFYKEVDANGEPRRAIPIEHVRGVLEVKATLNPKNTNLVAKKLSQLRHFIGENSSAEYPEYLCRPFICGAVFFETAVTSLKTYRRALDNLTTILQQEPVVPFIGGLVLRSEKEAAHSGYIRQWRAEAPFDFPSMREWSSNFRYPSGDYGRLGCFCYCVNDFTNFIFDLLASVRGVRRAGYSSSFYGLDYENTQGSQLFD